MKYLPPFAFAFLLAACAVTHEDKEAARQRQLAKEARENFIALKAQEHPGRPVVLHDEAAATPKPHLLSFFNHREPAPPRRVAATAPPPPPPAPPEQVELQAFRFKPTPKTYAAAKPTPHFVPTPPRKSDETVYYWQVPPPPRNSPREQAAEARYARELAKRPEELTPEERLYAREHY